MTTFGLFGRRASKLSSVGATSPNFLLSREHHLGDNVRSTLRTMPNSTKRPLLEVRAQHKLTVPAKAEPVPRIASRLNPSALIQFAGYLCGRGVELSRMLSADHTSGHCFTVSVRMREGRTRLTSAAHTRHTPILSIQRCTKSTTLRQLKLLLSLAPL